MYKKYIAILFLTMCIAGCCVMNLDGIRLNKALSGDLLQMTISEAAEKMESSKPQNTVDLRYVGAVKTISSTRRIVDYDILVNENATVLDDENFSVLCRIVEAEAGSEDIKGKMLVAAVVMNRVESPRFPDTVKEVVFQKSSGITQFSPVSDGRYFQVNVSQETVDAVNRVLQGEDESQGALFFMNRSYADGENVQWFDSQCKLLFSYGGHEFFS